MNELTLWSALKEIASEHPYMYVTEALERAQQRVLGIEIPKPVLPHESIYSHPVQFGHWIGENVPEAVQHIKDQKLINAIKAVRVASAAGLKEAKEGVECLRYDMGLGAKPSCYYAPF